MSKLNAIVLVPTMDFASLLERFSQTLSNYVPNQIILGKDGLAHVTVVQTNAPQDVLEAMISTFNMFWSTDTSITLAGLCLLPASRETWLEIPVLRSSKLSYLHSKVVEEITLKGFSIFSATEDAYRPHITVGYTDKSISSIPYLDSKILRASINGWKLYAINLGPHFSMPINIIKYE